MKPVWEKKDDALFLLAYASLKEWNEPTDAENIDAEIARIERVIEQFYLESPDEEYNAFILNWIKDNAHDLVYTDKFTYDVKIPDDPTETNVNLFCRKLDNP